MPSPNPQSTGAPPPLKVQIGSTAARLTDGATSAWRKNSE